MKLIDSKELKRRILDGCFLPDWVRVLINRVIDDMPDVNTEPVDAHWVPYFVEFKCSNCGGFAAMDFHGLHTVQDKYCRSCGARMDEVIKDGKS